MVTELLNWPTTQKSYGVEITLNLEGQHRVAAECAERVLADLKEKHPGKAVRVGFAWGGFAPHSGRADHG